MPQQPSDIVMQAPDDIRQRRMPVWAPNPAVPLPARILAFTFGGLIVLALVLSYWNKRPPDTPMFPEKWIPYHVEGLVTLPYPDGWVSEKENGQDTQQVTFMLSPGSPVRVMVLVRSLLGVADDAVIKDLEDDFQQRISARYYHFTPSLQTSQLFPSGRHPFTFQINRHRTDSMSGAWEIRAQGHYAVYLIATSPKVGWDVMANILNNMTNGLVFEKAATK